jgi:pilus assembly protein CpaB
MGSMDHLRKKIRNQSDTGDLELSAIDPQLSHIADTPPVQERLSSRGNTDSLISEIFESGTADLSPPDNFKMEPKKGNALFQRFQGMEVNRKMLIVSLSIAALASFLSMSYLKGIAEPLRGRSKLIKVVTLTQDVPARTTISSEMIKVSDIPQGYLPEGAVEYKENLKLLGQVTLTGLYKGEVLHKDRISLPNAETGITTIIPDGHRAINIRTDSINTSLIKPSTQDRKEYVDVMATIPDPNPARRGRLISIPILQRAVVLAVGDRLSGGASKEPSGGNSVTLAVPEDRVNLMVLIEEKGNLKVIPRSPTDDSTRQEKYTVQEIEDALLGKIESPVEEVPEPKAEPAKAEEPEPEAPAAPLVDLSGGSRPAYRAPARKPVYRAPARKPVYRAPAAPRAAAPKPAAPRPAAPKAQAPAPVRAPVVINGGVVTNK